MVDNVPICYGCCLDLQDLARTLGFEADPFRDLFDKVATVTNRGVRELRQTCLDHQQELIDRQLESATDPEERDALIGLAGRVSSALVQTRG
jgi:hypothetical protein